MSETTADTGDKTCPNCDFLNPSWRNTCDNCGYNFERKEVPAKPGKDTRPGCVTIYGYLLIGASALYLLGTIFAVFQDGLSTLGIGICILPLIAGVSFYVGYGLLRQENWARIVVIILNGLGILTSLYLLASGNGNSVFAILISGYIAYWFSVNGEHFT
jgi:hypothetical protein